MPMEIRWHRSAFQGRRNGCVRSIWSATKASSWTRQRACPERLVIIHVVRSRPAQPRYRRGIAPNQELRC